MSVNIFGRSKSLFKLTPQGDFDITMKHIQHVRAGIESDDATTLGMLHSKIEKLKNDIIAQIKEKKT